MFEWLRGKFLDSKERIKPWECPLKPWVKMLVEHVSITKCRKPHRKP